MFIYRNCGEAFCEQRFEIEVTRKSPIGLDKVTTAAISTTLSILGLGLALMSGLNFMNIAKFLQFLTCMVEGN